MNTISCTSLLLQNKKVTRLLSIVMTPSSPRNTLVCKTKVLTILKFVLDVKIQRQHQYWYLRFAFIIRAIITSSVVATCLPPPPFPLRCKLSLKLCTGIKRSHNHLNQIQLHWYPQLFKNEWPKCHQLKDMHVSFLLAGSC